MAAETLQVLPAILDADLQWVADLLKLRDLDEHRRAFLKRMDTVDVSACPGSGKTTLVVAKLALLARDWPWRTCGLCVLSHTNVAREEIQSRLGATDVGQRLLGYPHFIGTIHGFLSQFVVQPFLLSRGMAFRTFDDDQTDRTRRRTLGGQCKVLDDFLAVKRWSISRLRIKDLSFGLAEFPVGEETRMYALAAKAVKGAAEQGDFCYDDIFLLAQAALDEIPVLAEILRRRFPFVLLDEMQDTDTRQGGLLNRIFPRENAEISVQRVGDLNQAIFHGHQEREPSFPDPARSIPIADSFRFGPAIARVASPLAVTPIEGDLQGRRLEPFPTPVVFLFPGDHPENVLSAFGDAVLEAFPDDVLEHESVVAVAAVHKAKEEENADKKPCTLRDYWPAYQVALARKDQRPATLVEYLLLAQRRAKTEGTFHRAVNEVAFAMLQAIRLVNGHRVTGSRGSHHRRLLELLGEGAAQAYNRLLAHLLTQTAPMDVRSWEVHQSSFEAWVRLLAQKEFLGFACSEFLSWPEAPFDAAKVSHAGPVNTFRHARGDRQVDIRLNSIHGVKGETHLATLVLDVKKDRWFHLKHQLDNLCGQPRPKKGLGTTEAVHARLAYVAMTRPTHLLALALRSSDLGEGSDRDKRIRELEAQGWRIVDLASPDPIAEAPLEEEAPCLS